MKEEITIPVIMFDEDNIDIRKILDLFEIELTQLAESKVTLDWKWFLMNMDKDGEYCCGIVKGHEVEMGSFSLDELKSMQPRIQRDLYFEPMKAKDVWEQLNKGEWV